MLCRCLNVQATNKLYMAIGSAQFRVDNIIARSGSKCAIEPTLSSYNNLYICIMYVRVC